MAISTQSTDSLENVPLNRSRAVLQTLAEEHDPDHVYAAVSGGDDSTTALHVAANSDVIELDGVVHLDTGIGISKTEEHVRSLCESLGVDLVVLGNDNARFGHERYEHLVTQFGFPGANPIAHDQMWKNLKDKLTGRFNSSLAGDLALISGVRKHESQNRYKELSKGAIQEVSGITWASPLIDFTDDDLKAYRDHHEMEENIVSALLCTSGECLCGSFADRNSLPLIEQYFPDAAQQIYHLEWEVLEMCARGEVKKDFALWAHGSVDEGEYEARTDADQTRLMCSDCDERCPSGPYEMTGNPKSPAEAFLQQNDLRDFWNRPFYCAICDRVVEDPYGHRQEVHPFDAEDGVASEWDMRQIDIAASDQSERILTEPNGWNIHPGQITRDESEADRYKSKFHFEDVAISHCSGHDHSWEPYNDGPVKRCQDCFAFDLSAYDHREAGPPVIDTEDDGFLTADESEAVRIHQQLSDFR